nr:immunoglobulin light chain junction region [Macaca mulatta]MOW60425.1 immunoglobulin light chain junction region [Macaca mulatta]MOW61486.1 immunoglobulin light chain junction region [Macaca mulatta]
DYYCGAWDSSLGAYIF